MSARTEKSEKFMPPFIVSTRSFCHIDCYSGFGFSKCLFNSKSNLQKVQIRLSSIREIILLSLEKQIVFLNFVLKKDNYKYIGKENELLILYSWQVYLDRIVIATVL
jgi:hypothetical protein